MIATTPGGFLAVLLAGGLRRAPIAEEIGLPVLALPVDGQRVLLDLWADALASIGCAAMRVVVSDEHDRATLCALADVRGRRTPPIHVETEPARWRGTAGLLRDMVGTSGDPVLLVEGSSLPPSDIGRLRAGVGMPLAEGGAAAIVGVDVSSRPSGQYMLCPGALEYVPTVGFFDVKEQLLPALYDAGFPARAVVVTDATRRVNDRVAYREALQSIGEAEIAAPVGSGARMVGHTLIAPGAVIGDDAVIHDSVVMAGATIEPRAVVSRSVIGPGACVSAGAVIRDATVGGVRESRVIGRAG